MQAFAAYPNAQWIFAIDGLPKDSHRYRINQDGEKLFEMMKESKKYLVKKPVWQYILFKYNENDIDQAFDIATEHDVEFFLIDSARFDEGDPLKPKKQGIK